MPEALCDVSATIGPGIYLLAGANGAGKTTLLHILAGVTTPDAGECTLDGQAVSSDNPEIKKEIFFIEEEALLPGNTIREFAKRHACFYPNFSEEKLEENLSSFGLTGYESLKSLSLGNRKKSALAYALALGVQLLLLDEPGNGLDIQGKDTLRHLLAANINDSQTVIVATHSPGDLESLFDGAIFMKRANIIASATADTISSRIAFVNARNSSSPLLYSEMILGQTYGIVTIDQDSLSTKVDWRMLYNSLHSDSAPTIIGILNKKSEI